MSVELSDMPATTEEQTHSLAAKRVLILGAGRTGLAVAQALHDKAQALQIADDDADKFTGNAAYQRLGLDVQMARSLLREGLEAHLVVMSPGIPAEHPLVKACDARGIEVVSEVELAYRLSPYPICAVTGTNGKSTVAALMAKMLQAEGFDAVLCGNISADEAKMPLITAATQPQGDPPRILCAEVSSFQLGRCPTFAPMIGVLTTLGQDHLNRYGSLQSYWAAKRRMFAHQTADQLAVFSADQPEQAALLAGLAAQQARFSVQDALARGAYLDGGALWIAESGHAQRLCHVSELQLLGLHNYANVLAAALAARSAGASLEAIRRTATTFITLPHRLEKVAVVKNISYVNNSMCTNPQAAVASLEAFSEGLIVIAGGMGKNLDVGPYMDALARRAKHVVLIGQEAPQMKNGLARRAYTSVSLADSLQDAVTKAAKLAKSGDIVILNPGFASFDQFQDFEDRGEAFRRCVRELKP